MVTCSMEEEDETALSAFARLVQSGGGSAKATDVSMLESKLGGPCEVVAALMPNLWLPHSDSNNTLSILVHLVETYPKKYMSLAASAVRRSVEKKFDTAKMDTGEQYEVCDDLLLALSKLLVAPNSDTQIGIATDAHAALLSLCRWDNHAYHKILVCQNLFKHLATLWHHLQQQRKRESSTAQMRIAALMIDVCLLGGKEMTLALSNDQLMNKLLYIALDCPNEDPLLQMAAFDQIERLAIHSKDYPMTSERADFLLGNGDLHQGLLYMVGSPSDALSSDIEFDPVNGWAAVRVLTEISRLGMSSSISIAESTQQKFHSLLGSFQRALHELKPQGESERLMYIYAVSSLVASSAVSNNEEMSKFILEDTKLLNGWLSLLSRSSQSKLKSAVLSSLSQVMEPGMWQEEEAVTSRPSDYIALTLYHAFGEANNQKDPTECLLVSAKSPFVEERLGAYNVFRAMVMRGTCARLLLLHRESGVDCNGTSIFLKWLLNHDNESTSEGRQAKYSIAESLLSGVNNIDGLIPNSTIREMQLWMKRGPAHTQTLPWDMATE